LILEPFWYQKISGTGLDEERKKEKVSRTRVRPWKGKHRFPSTSARTLQFISLVCLVKATRTIKTPKNCTIKMAVACVNKITQDMSQA